MMHKMKALLTEKLAGNPRNFIVYYEGNARKVKTFRELARDVDAYGDRFNLLRSRGRLAAAGILGPTSYDWLVADLACLKLGIRSVALPEVFSPAQVEAQLAATGADILLVDYRLRDRVLPLAGKVDVYFMACPPATEGHFLGLPPLPRAGNEATILEAFSTGFTAGTTETVKQITFKFPSRPTPAGLLNKLKGLVAYKTSFWSARDNKVILFMPFSHFQQRLFAMQALLMNVNIVLSDPVNCIKHIILEKPNIMVSVPVVYETLAQRIKVKLDRFNGWQKFLLAVFNRSGISGFSNRNPIKKAFSQLLFRDIRKIYGGRVDYFVTGSAPIRPDVLRVFYRIGVKVFEAYGQSESEIIAINTEKHFRIGSVGKPRIAVKISPESEILLPYDEARHGHNRHVLQVDAEGYVHTGDLGHLDRDGFLYVTGRKDDVIVLANGKKVFPGEVEQKLTQHPLIRQALVFSANNENLSLIVNAEGAGKPNGLAGDLKHSLAELNRHLPDYQKISSFHLAAEPFTVENGLLTPTFKLKRKSIVSRFREEAFTRVN